MCVHVHVNLECNVKATLIYFSLFLTEDSDYDKLMHTLGQPISPQDIILVERIGEGEFGDIYKGRLYPNVSDYVEC